MIRIKDIAARAGVSTTTVSNVIHQKEGKVSPELTARIQALIQEMGYVPSLSARMLAKEHSRLIGVVIHWGEQERQRRSLLAASLAGHLEQCIRAKGYYMMPLTGCPLEQVVQESRAWNYDGLILGGLTDDQLTQLRQELGKPMVAIGSWTEEPKEGLCRVGADQRGGGEQIGRYVLERGHRSLLFLADSDQGEQHLRWQGFRAALAAAGLPRPEEVRRLLPREQAARLDWYEQQLPWLRRHTALCFASDALAVEGMNRLRALGVPTPEDISVTGFGDFAYARATWPELTTVHLQVEEQARLAVELLTRLMSGEPVEQRSHWVETRVAERGSVARLAPAGESAPQG